jgi:hypothetical protein
MKQVPVTVSPSHETSEEIIRIARCSDEEIIKILEKKTKQKQCFSIFKTIVKVIVRLVMFL